MNASDTRTKWCSRVKNVLCSNASVTKAFTSCSNGSSTRMPTDFWCAPSGSASFTPSLAACIRPGPPPVTMSHPSRVSSAAVSRTAAYTQWPGSTRADPKMVTRYRSRLVGRRRVRALTVSHRPRTDCRRMSRTAGSSDRGTSPPSEAALVSLMALLGFPTSVRPLPVRRLRLVHPVLVGVVGALNLQVPEPLLGVCPDPVQPRHPVDDVHRQGEVVDLVLDGQFERGVDVPLLLVPADVQVLVPVPAVGQPVDQPWVPVEGEDDRLVGREQGVEVAVVEPVRVLGVRLEPEQVHHVDEPDLQVLELLPEQVHGRQGLLGRDVAGRGHYHVRFDPLVGARLGPDADP